MLQPRSNTFATLTVVVLLSAAWAWRDCMLVAATAALAFRMFLLRAEGPSPALSVGLDRLTGGLLVALAGATLVGGVASIWLGWWVPALDHPALSILLLAPAAAHCCLLRSGTTARCSELGLWIAVMVAMALAREAEIAGVAVAPCIFVAVIGVALLRAGWRLAGETTTGLLRISPPWN